MRCPFCAEDIQADASVCCHCGNDLRIPDALMAENYELKQTVIGLKTQVVEMRAALARNRKPVDQMAQTAVDG